MYHFRFLSHMVCLIASIIYQYSLYPNATLGQTKLCFDFIIHDIIKEGIR